MREGGKEMKKGLVLTVLIVVSLVGCAGGKLPSEGPPPKLPPRQVNIQNEIKSATNLPQGSLLEPTQDFKSAYDVPGNLQKNFFTPNLVTPGTQNNHLFQAWIPDPMNHKGTLTKLWSLDTDWSYINRIGREQYEKDIDPWVGATIDTLPEGWLIHVLNIQGVQDAKNGKKIANLRGGVGISEIHSEFMFGKPYELQEIKEISAFMPAPFLCWNKRTGGVRWRIVNTGISKGKIYFVYNGAIYLFLLGDCLAKIDAWTGTIEWAIKVNPAPPTPPYVYDIAVPYYWQFSSNYMWLLYFTDEYGKNINVCRLDTEKLEIMRVKLGNIQGVMAKDNKVCIVHDNFKKVTVLSEDGIPQNVIEVPKEITGQLKEKKEFLGKPVPAPPLIPYGDKMIFGFFNSKYRTNDNKMIFVDTQEYYQPYLFDPLGMTKPVLLPKDIKPTDFKQVYPFLLWKDFYIEDDKNFYGFDIESGQKTWSIPKSELGPNPAISISDWRGVLVVDEKQFTAWGAK